MKNYLRPFVSFVAVAVIPTFCLAVYAPLPEQDQGKALSLRLGASVYQDSNIFGGATNEKSSAVYKATLGIAFNGSLSAKTFATLSYDVSDDHVVNRPGNKDLVNHSFSARLAHSFSEATNIDILESYQINKSPESFIILPVRLTSAADQSAKNNQFSIRFQTSAGEKGGIVLKYRNSDSKYDVKALADDLDHNDNLFGVEGSFALLPTTKLVGEYRYGTVRYGNNGVLKDKNSNYFMAGFDHNPNEKVTLTGRLGVENRKRESQGSTTSPYSEFSVNYAYAEGSFISGAYTFGLEEPSDVQKFTDTKVNRFIGTVQHHLSALVIASSSLTYESSVLQGRRGNANLNESARRFGVALTWQPTKNWDISATFDNDHTTSDDVNRTQDRTRYGIGAKFSF